MKVTALATALLSLIDCGGGRDSRRVATENPRNDTVPVVTTGRRLFLAATLVLSSTAQPAFLINSNGQLVNSLQNHGLTACTWSEERTATIIEVVEQGEAQLSLESTDWSFSDMKNFERFNALSKSSGIVQIAIEWHLPNSRYTEAERSRALLLTKPRITPNAGEFLHPERLDDEYHSDDLIYLEATGLKPFAVQWDDYENTNWLLFTNAEIDQLRLTDNVKLKVSNLDHPHITPIYIEFDTGGLTDIPLCIDRIKR